MEEGVSFTAVIYVICTAIQDELMGTVKTNTPSKRERERVKGGVEGVFDRPVERHVTSEHTLRQHSS